MTNTERLAAIDAAIDRALLALSTGSGVPPLDVSYLQDPDGGQLTFRNPTDPIEQIEALRKLRQAVVQDGVDEEAEVTEHTAFVLVRRRN